MALTRVTLQELQHVLLKVIGAARYSRPTTGAIFQLLYDTGLRVREVLEVERWNANDDDTYTVQLEKQEGTRIIQVNDVPGLIEQRYADNTPFTMETYSAVNNMFKRYAPGLLFGNDVRRTTCHAFRYQFMKQLSENGMSTAQIAETMGHVNLANTARYITDEIWLGS